MKYLTTEDLEEVLKISKKQANLLVRTEGFPGFRLGAQYRVEENDLYKWLKESDRIRFDYSRR